MNTHYRPIMLLILDGWGITSQKKGNAFAIAQTPCLDHLAKTYPTTSLACSGEDVGLPSGVMGNSEVGHLNIGSGRIVKQDLLRINAAIADGTFFQNEALNAIMERVIAAGTTLHLLGLVSDGGVHSHIDHLKALLEMARSKGVPKTYIHAILDGRDTSPHSGRNFLNQLQSYIDQKQYGTLASICGRYYAMDRDQRWDRTQKAYQLYAHGKGEKTKDLFSALKNDYANGESDEFILPRILADDSGRTVASVNQNDGIIAFNYRADRMRQITRAFTVSDFNKFKRERFPFLSDWVTMTRYDESFDLPVVFSSQHLSGILGEIISRKGLRQLRAAETEKYAHVTYFFNGGEETPFSNEDRCLVPSPREVATYDQKPEMSAREVTRMVLDRIAETQYDLVVLNLANTDMVGHTGVLSAAVKACETVDGCVSEIVNTFQQQGGALIITADHGNCEKMIAADGSPHTAHTTNPVPLILVDTLRKSARLKTGRLADIAPTILEIMGIPQPAAMTGRSLLS